MSKLGHDAIHWSPSGLVPNTREHRIFKLPPPYAHRAFGGECLFASRSPRVIVARNPTAVSRRLAGSPGSVDPRACGVGLEEHAVRRIFAGSSPLVRGVRSPFGYRGFRHPVHPRACAAAQEDAMDEVDRWGSSPRVRGRRLRWGVGPCSRRLIPARARQPVPAGDLFAGCHGLSLRVRGGRWDHTPSAGVPRRSIPACAGPARGCLTLLLSSRDLLWRPSLPGFRRGCARRRLLMGLMTVRRRVDRGAQAVRHLRRTSPVRGRGRVASRTPRAATVHCWSRDVEQCVCPILVELLPTAGRS